MRKSLKDINTWSPAVLRWLGQAKAKFLEILEGAIKKKARRDDFSYLKIITEKAWGIVKEVVLLLFELLLKFFYK